MTSPGDRKSAAPLQPETVADLLRIEGFPPVEDDVVARIAAGGTNAVKAVVAARRGSIFDADPGTYLSELDRLAGPDDP
jgi:dephospho-CoA kinase